MATQGNLPYVGKEPLVRQADDDFSENEDTPATAETRTPEIIWQPPNIRRAAPYHHDIWQPANIRRVVPYHHRRLEIPGNRDEQSHSERVESNQKRRKESVGCHEPGAGATSKRPKVKSKKSPPQDPSTKCQQCFLERRACDQAKPNCGTCVKRRRICVPQGGQDQDPNIECDSCVQDGLVCDQSRPECENCQARQRACGYQKDPQSSGEVRFKRKEPDRTRDRRFGQSPAEKCHYCFHRGYWCDGKIPCCRCVKDEVPLCRPQDANLKGLRGISLEDRCWPCRRKRLMCNGEEPCNICLQGKRPCYRDKPPPPQSGYRCLNCEAHGYICDGATPCNTCIRTGRSVCKHETEDGFIERHYDIRSVGNEVYEDCLGCVARPKKTIRCDRKRPCNNCLDRKTEKSCCYQIEAGLKIWISKRGDAASRWKHKARETGDVHPGEETSNDGITSEGSSEFESDDYDDLYEESDNSAAPSRAR